MVTPLALPAESGHFDELLGSSVATTTGPFTPPTLTAAWKTFFDHLGSIGLDDLDRRIQTLERQVRDNGITFNLYADQRQSQRPWALDIFPLILTPQSWKDIEQGVVQRALLLEALMADVYGAQRLLSEAMIPPALVHGHPGYVRAMHGVAPVGGSHLHLAAFDLVRNPQGRWVVMSQRTQAPSGLGYLLENRILISRHFPEAFEAMHIQRLATSYRMWVESLKRHSPAGASAHVALLTPGPYNETYFEHVYLARYLGLTLVEGSDLTVRHERLYLRTLSGLEPVHVLLKRLDDDFLDPLELRSDSTLGIPGLLQAIRAGHVLVANAPGSAFLESPALLGFLPSLCERLLDEPLQLPALDTWWCGERAVLPAVLPELERTVIKPTYWASAHHRSFEAVLARDLTPSQREQWAQAIQAKPDHHTLQFHTAASQMPTWTQGSRGVTSRPVILRVFAMRDGANSWRVLPGGLARLVGPNAQVASMQRGGSSADVWVQTDAEIDRSTLLASGPTQTVSFTPRQRLVTSRAAENLFWLGRYTERSENMVRLVRLSLEALNGEDTASDSLLNWLQQLAETQGLVPRGVPKMQSKARGSARRRVFERTLIESLDQHQHVTSVGFNLRALHRASYAVRERLSAETWQMIDQAMTRFSQDCAQAVAQPDFSTVQALQALDSLSASLAALTGAQTDRMTRDDGWQLLSIGRHVERLGFLAEALQLAVDSGAFHAHPLGHDINSSHYTALLALFDSSITFRAQHQQSRELQPLLSLLVEDDENPRALAWVARALRSRLSKLAHTPMGVSDAMGEWVPDVHQWPVDALCQRNETGQLTQLQDCLDACSKAAWQVSDAITARYFRHTESAGSVGV